MVPVSRMETINEILLHTTTCRAVSCRRTPCKKMKLLLAHSKTCELKKVSRCPACSDLVAICCHHSEHFCKKTECCVPYCKKYKEVQKRPWVRKFFAKSAEPSKEYHTWFCTFYGH